MTQRLPESGKILVLAPHPDDEALGCGGTIALLSRRNIPVSVVFLTDGESLEGEPSSAVAEARRQEGRSACKILGCPEPRFLGFPDGGLRDCLGGLFQALAGIIGEEQPDIVFAPSPVDFHADHRVAANISLELLKSLNSFRLAFYEIYSTVRFTWLVDIRGAVEEKRRAIMNYQKSLYGRPELYAHASLGLNAQRSIFTEAEGYYEAFWVLEEPLGPAAVSDWLTYRT